MSKLAAAAAAVAAAAALVAATAAAAAALEAASAAAAAALEAASLHLPPSRKTEWQAHSPLEMGEQLYRTGHSVNFQDIV